MTIHPRRLARSMAKARTRRNDLSLLDWRQAAADQAKDAAEREKQKRRPKKH